jgi:hypothetical protein
VIVAPSAYKFGAVNSSGEESSFRYSDTWALGKTSGASRLKIAPSDEQVDLMQALSSVMNEPFGVLYVLVVPRAQGKAGRYQSSQPLSREALDLFLLNFREFLENDARHHLWIASVDKTASLIYDNHNVIHGYGPIDSFKTILNASGFYEVEKVSFPAPHTHHYNAAFDQQEIKLLEYQPWTVFPLQDSDV